ncbi:hypothetical protein [Haloarcula montana]|uniref:hypothetical protein n=1 Tax=Haloarcula montana TaxID=3111776 RepID=UPI002D77CC8F|nr:hypothetical protein [Haloarcula sp. GH36]
MSLLHLYSSILRNASPNTISIFREVELTEMSLTVNHVIQLLQVIILAITAVIYISQLVLRFTVASDNVELIDIEEDASRVSSFIQNFRSMLASVALFLLSGAILAFYLVFLSVPGEIDSYMGPW